MIQQATHDMNEWAAKFLAYSETVQRKEPIHYESTQYSRGETRWLADEIP
jgi:hypothetical protein